MVRLSLNARSSRRGSWSWTEKHTGVLTCSDGGKDGHKSKVFYTQEIEFTDFPLPEITLWFQNNTIFLPSEY